MADGGGETGTPGNLSNSNDSGSNSPEGRLKKQGKYSTKWYNCTAKLEKDCFVYKRDDKLKSKLILLVNAQLVHQEDNECIFIIIDSKNKKRKLVFKTINPEECRRWMESLFDAILECKQEIQQQDKSEACSIQ